MTARTRPKPNFPVIQDELTPLFEVYSTESEFELTNTLAAMKTLSRDLREITKQAVSQHQPSFHLLIPSVEIVEELNCRG